MNPNQIIAKTFIERALLFHCWFKNLYWIKRLDIKPFKHIIGASSEDKKKISLLSDQEIKAKDGAGVLSSRRHNEIFQSRPLRVSSSKRPGPAAGQASLCDLWFSLSGIMIALTISWRHAIRGRLCLRADPRRRSCLLTTAESGFLVLMAGNRGFKRSFRHLRGTALPRHRRATAVISARVTLRPLRILVAQ